MVTKPKLGKKFSFPFGALFLLSILPIFLRSYPHIMNILILCFIWGMVAAAWNLIMGYARVFSLGQMAFFTFGAYTSAILTMNLGISPWVGIPIGGTIAAAVGFLIGLPCLRLRGIYVAVVTLALHLVLPTLLMHAGPIPTGGSYGLGGIPSLQLGGYTFSYQELIPWYYVALAIFLVVLFVIYKIINSSVGLAFIAIRDAEPFAKSLGVDEYKYMLMVFGISAFFTGISGAFYAHYIRAISPKILGLDLFLLALVMVLFGGLGRFPGAVIGAFAITFINNFLLGTGAFRLVILGAIVIVTMIYMPQGLMGIPESFNRLVRRTSKRGVGEGERRKLL